ncbi:MAG: phosphatidylglycerophosphatase A [Gammaproteobacteria bacterium]|nr:phosphatidylglycerophosphatase A [Gammaproteobacteria bacterium]
MSDNQLNNKPRIPAFKELLAQPVLMLGFGFGSGLAKKAPGTFGTLLGLLLFIPIVLWSEWLAWAVLIVATAVGSYICGRSSELLNVHDHGGIVWDEFVGIWLVLLLLPEQSWLFWGLAFLTFRLFDIWKPWPIKWIDEHIEGGFGIMLDDVLAAIYAISVIWIYQYWLL